MAGKTFKSKMDGIVNPKRKDADDKPYNHAGKKKITASLKVDDQRPTLHLKKSWRCRTLN